MIIINIIIFKNILKHLTSERTSLHAGNLSYLTFVAHVPSFIITLSIFKILSKYLPIIEHPYLAQISDILSFLNLNNITSIVINIICINLLSSGIFSLLTTFQKLYKIPFKNYLHKKIYSLMLAIIIIFIIVLSLSVSFTIQHYTIFKNITFFIDLAIIFLSLLIFYKLSTFQKIKNIYTGTIISSLVLTIFLHLFYTIITNFTKLKQYYGAITPIIILLLLIYYSCYIIYLGIIVNYETSRIKIIKKQKILTGKITNA